jgi:AraC-like DNA-binding protein
MTSLAMPLPMPLQLIPPSAGLASCIRGYVSRSTVGQAEAAQSRQNHLPAALTCAITWFIEGKSTVLGPWADVMGRLHAARGVSADSAPVVFNGPRTQGIVTVDQGPVQSFMVVLMPDAFDQAWHRMAQTVLEAPTDALRIQQIEAFLEPRWRAACEQGQSQMRRYQDWVQDLARRAQDHGHSLRQTQRRIKDWAGLSLRQLQGIVRLESSLNQAQLGDGDAKPDWSQIACDNGFSDQAHFCREVRRASGLSPTALRKAVADDEGYWMYRLLRT